VPGACILRLGGDGAGEESQDEEEYSHAGMVARNSDRSQAESFGVCGIQVVRRAKSLQQQSINCNIVRVSANEGLGGVSFDDGYTVIRFGVFPDDVSIGVEAVEAGEVVEVVFQRQN
jgi:hypothetical protein